MPTTFAQRQAFAATAHATTPPSVLLVMLYDRLALDLERAEQAQRAGDPPTANRQLQHAQEIVIALAGNLEVDVWDGAPRLKALYSWLLKELVQSNVTKDPTRTVGCRGVVEPLRDAWREASAVVARTAPPTLGGIA